MRTLTVETTGVAQLLDITQKVQDAVTSEGVPNGICVVYVMHTTAGITINENADPSVRADIIESLSKLVPKNWPYGHSEGNSPAHIKSSLLGHSVTITIEQGRLMLGTWQGIFLCEFDGPRRRSVIVMCIPNA